MVTCTSVGGGTPCFWVVVAIGQILGVLPGSVVLQREIWHESKRCLHILCGPGPAASASFRSLLEISVPLSHSTSNGSESAF